MKTVIVDQRIQDTDFRVESWVGDKMNTRIRNGLQRNGIHTVDQLVMCTRKDIEKISGLGIVCLVIIELKLKKMGLRLRK